MVIYRVKQFMWAIASKFKPIDISVIKKYLNNDEENLFNKLSKSEKHHSIRVCKDALSKSILRDVDKEKLAKIALLHDVGKSLGNLNIIDKSLIVILDKMTKGRLKRYNFSKKIDIYYNHPKKSVELLRNIHKYDDEFIEAIRKHHGKDIGTNVYLKIVKECDDSN
ncbi:MULTISPECIES: HD domain-containing protein [Clostridium]|uniref:HDIG domain-containing protein n=1 Tax=Clostridium cibarium TaxID=2762247 RepID=A0ABR8PRQ2_9CLOT|nr:MULTISPECIES: HD domain-containing protein [Clostridium]MBD7910842.1 HDIG domain-containing protein [Clostridium cibarium]